MLGAYVPNGCADEEGDEVRKHQTTDDFEAKERRLVLGLRAVLEVRVDLHLTEGIKLKIGCMRAMYLLSGSGLFGGVVSVEPICPLRWRAILKQHVTFILFPGVLLVDLT